jgi:hypothetical protein
VASVTGKKVGTHDPEPSGGIGRSAVTREYGAIGDGW